MHVVAINGSPRKKGNTFQLLEAMCRELEQQGITTEIIQAGSKNYNGCTACGYCKTAEGSRCIFKDGLNEEAQKMREADGIILSAPTYYGGIAGNMKCFLDRVFYTSSAYFAYKPATVVAAVRRTGGLDVVHGLDNYLRLARTVTAPSHYWTVVHGHERGEVEQDLEGMQTIRQNARSMAWLLKSLAAAKESVPYPEEEKERQRTNFIR